jgi:hypothetical protein
LDRLDPDGSIFTARWSRETCEFRLDVGVYVKNLSNLSYSGGLKKRKAEYQLTKDEGDEDDDDNEEDGPVDRAAPFSKASEDVLARRKIFKLKRPASSSGGGGGGGDGGW